MAGKKQFPNGSWQYTFKRAGVLESPIYLTFDTEVEGDAFAAKLDALLDRGIVPAEYQIRQTIISIAELVKEYERDAHPSAKDMGALRTILPTRGSVTLDRITAGWVDDWIQEMKRVDNLAPATIRAKVGALARATDWGMRKGLCKFPDHPLRSLPDGYAQYTKADAKLAKNGQRQDVERDRRLEPGEWERILQVLDVGVLPRQQRPLKLEGRRDKRALKCFVVLAVETAMRMREMFTLTYGQVDLDRRTIFLDKTKNGDKRQVPLSSVALQELRDFGYLGDAGWHAPDARVFPFWNGDEAKQELDATSDFLSNLFMDIFRQAGCEGLKFHDLRHEAVSRFFERTNLTETQIMKISGHKSHRMLMRYANLRGSTLAAALW